MIFQMLLQMVLTDTMRMPHGDKLCLQSGIGGRNETGNNQFLKVKFDRFLRILRESVAGGMVFCGFFQRLSVISPSCNS